MKNPGANPKCIANSYDIAFTGGAIMVTNTTPERVIIASLPCAG